MAFGDGHGGGSGFHSGGEGGGGVSLNLTALMDILSNLLFFLLASYSAQAMEVEQKADLRLPSSSSQTKLTPELTITVSRRDIQVAGVPVVEIADGQLKTQVGEGDKIVPLFDRLKNAKAARQAAGRADDVQGDVALLLADKGTDAGIITKVLKTAGMAGFVNFRFGVISR